MIAPPVSRQPLNDPRQLGLHFVIISDAGRERVDNPFDVESVSETCVGAPCVCRFHLPTTPSFAPDVLPGIVHGMYAAADHEGVGQVGAPGADSDVSDHPRGSQRVLGVLFGYAATRSSFGFEKGNGEGGGCVGWSGGCGSATKDLCLLAGYRASTATLMCARACFFLINDGNNHAAPRDTMAAYMHALKSHTSTVLERSLETRVHQYLDAEELHAQLRFEWLSRGCHGRVVGTGVGGEFAGRLGPILL